MSPRRPRRRRRSGPAPEPGYPTLDLHGATAAEVRRRLPPWIASVRSAGEDLCLVVTGRGLHSEGPPVVREEVRCLLTELAEEGVTGFDPVSAGGAFRVRLAPPPPRAGPGEPPATASPALRRRAQEALEELGVEPTPELLAAEIRRLMREEGGSA